MKAQFIVTIEGNWRHNSERVTPAIVERELREAIRGQFEFLAKRRTVKRLTKAEEAALARGADAKPSRAQVDAQPAAVGAKCKRCDGTGLVHNSSPVRGSCPLCAGTGKAAALARKEGE